MKTDTNKAAKPALTMDVGTTITDERELTRNHLIETATAEYEEVGRSINAAGNCFNLCMLSAQTIGAALQGDMAQAKLDKTPFDLKAEVNKVTKYGRTIVEGMEVSMQYAKQLLSYVRKGIYLTIDGQDPTAKPMTEVNKLVKDCEIYQQGKQNAGNTVERGPATPEGAGKGGAPVQQFSIDDVVQEYTELVAERQLGKCKAASPKVIEAIRDAITKAGGE